MVTSALILLDKTATGQSILGQGCSVDSVPLPPKGGGYQGAPILCPPPIFLDMFIKFIFFDVVMF